MHHYLQKQQVSILWQVIKYKYDTMMMMYM